MKLVPGDFKVPDSVMLGSFHLQPLSIDDLEEDYKAVMESIELLQGTFGTYSSWPSSDLTKRQDLVDLGWHEKEFQRRSSFAYVVEDERARAYIGCLYIFPSDTKGYDADVYMWLRTSAYSPQRLQELHSEAEKWLTSWPFERLRFPGKF